MVKTCQYCSMDKSLVEFVKSGKICKMCNNAKVKAHYSANESYKQSVKDRAKSMKKVLTRYINDFKSKYGCRFCAETNPICLQFHHLDPSLKSFQVYGGTKRSLVNYRSEIDKCEILCANCHLRLHAGELHIDERRNIDSTTLIFN